MQRNAEICNACDAADICNACAAADICNACAADANLLFFCLVRFVSYIDVVRLVIDRAIAP